MNRCQHTATKPPKNYPLYDLDIDGTRYSLKTQADDRLSWRKVWISKMMELNTGKWDSDDSDLIALLDQYMTHIAGCDRILMLRTLQKAPEPWHYELVEIPKDLLLEAKDGTLEMMHNSKQMPKPGYCRVKDSIGKTKFELYFDGGGERKLQVKNLDRELCITHANWIFSDTFALEQSVGG